MSSDSYLTDEEITALQSSDLHRRYAFLIRNVATSYFSVARYSNGCKIQGCNYTYIHPTDELIRDDVLAWILKKRKAEKPKPEPKPAKEKNRTPRMVNHQPFFVFEDDDDRDEDAVQCAEQKPS